MSAARRRLLLDLGERALWTGAQAVLGLITVDALDIPVGYAAIVALGLSVIKGFVASKVGQSDSASTVPSLGTVER